MITLPYPPSVNRMWRNVNGRTILSEEGRAYRTDVLAAVLTMRDRPCFEGRIAVSIVAYAPDNRRRDLDNVCKGLLDGMQHAGVYGDDSQIDRLTVERGNVDKAKPRVEVRITEMVAESRQPEHVDITDYARSGEESAGLRFHGSDGSKQNQRVGARRAR